MTGILVVRQFESTPKAFANFSPAVGAQRQPWDIVSKRDQTLKGFAGRQTLSGFDHSILLCTLGFSLCSNPGLELANAFGVNSKLHHYRDFGNVLVKRIGVDLN